MSEFGDLHLVKEVGLPCFSMKSLKHNELMTQTQIDLDGLIYTFYRELNEVYFFIKFPPLLEICAAGLTFEEMSLGVVKCVLQHLHTYTTSSSSAYSNIS